MNGKKKLLLWLLVLVIVLFFARYVTAGELEVNWEASSIATGYRIHRGPTPGNYDDVREVGDFTQYIYADWPEDCQILNVAVKAYNGAGESLFSAVVATVGRPEIEDVVLNNDGLHQLVGKNFGVGATVWINATGEWVQIAPGSVRRARCDLIEIPAVPAYQIKVANVATRTDGGNPGSPGFLFSLPWPGPANVTVE